MDAEVERALPDPTLLRSHRLWRPEWSRGRVHLMWYLTFEGQAELQARVRELRPVLDRDPAVDVVPVEWLHCTLDAVGDIDAVPADRVPDLMEAAEAARAGCSLPELRLGRVQPMEDSLVLPLEPRDALDGLRDLLCTATASALEDHGPHDPGPFEPHVSIAYVNTDCSADALLRAVGDLWPADAVAAPASVALAAVTRHERHYDWTAAAVIPVGRA